MELKLQINQSFCKLAVPACLHTCLTTETDAEATNESNICSFNHQSIAFA